MSSKENSTAQQAEQVVKPAHTPLARIDLNRAPVQMSTTGPNPVVLKNSGHSLYYVTEGYVRATSGTVVIVLKGKVIANSGSTVVVYPGVEVVKAHPRAVVIKVSVGV